MKIVEFNCLENLEKIRNGESVLNGTVLANFRGKLDKHTIYGELVVMDWEEKYLQYVCDCKYRDITYCATQYVLMLNTDWLDEEGIKKNILKTFTKGVFAVPEKQINEMLDIENWFVDECLN